MHLASQQNACQRGADDAGEAVEGIGQQQHRGPQPFLEQLRNDDCRCRQFDAATGTNNAQRYRKDRKTVDRHHRNHSSSDQRYTADHDLLQSQDVENEYGEERADKDAGRQPGEGRRRGRYGNVEMTCDRPADNTQRRNERRHDEIGEKAAERDPVIVPH